MSNDTDIQMRKRNMKLFPMYKKFAWDYLFYYSIDFLFLTQIKNISAADVVLAKFISSLATSIKEIAEPRLLNASIPPSRCKSIIFAKINAKGASGFYI